MDSHARPTFSGDHAVAKARSRVLSRQRRGPDGVERVCMTGWAARLIETPWVFDHGRQRYMLYNGDRYGLTGFGLAVLEHD